MLLNQAQQPRSFVDVSLAMPLVVALVEELLCLEAFSLGSSWVLLKFAYRSLKATEERELPCFAFFAYQGADAKAMSQASSRRSADDLGNLLAVLVQAQYSVVAP